jgi:hypothetical protein
MGDTIFVMGGQHTPRAQVIYDVNNSTSMIFVIEMLK